MVITFFGDGKFKHLKPLCMAWIQLGMFPIEAYAYVATSVCIQIYHINLLLIQFQVYHSLNRWRGGEFVDDFNLDFENCCCIYELFLGILRKLENDPVFTQRRISLFQQALTSQLW